MGLDKDGAVSFVGKKKGFVVFKCVIKEFIIWCVKNEIYMNMNWSWKERKTQDFKDEGFNLRKRGGKFFQ